MRPARRRHALFARARRRRRERRHDRAESRPTRSSSRAPPEDRARRPRAMLDGARRRAGQSRDDLGKISLIGAGMKSHPGVAAEMFATLAEAGINIEIISTSSIKIACVVRAGRRRARGARARTHSGLARSASAPAIGVVGATGAVGAVTLDAAARARLRRRARLRVGALGRQASSAATTVEEATPEALARGDVDLFLFSVGTSALARARAARRARRRGRDRQVGGLPARAGRPARRARGERRRARSSTTASSRTRTAARSRSPAC